MTHTLGSTKTIYSGTVTMPSQESKSGDQRQDTPTLGDSTPQAMQALE